MLGYEQDFVFADTRVNRDWMRVFYGTRRLLRFKNGSLVNRKRIRNIMEPMAAVAVLESRTPKEVFGTPISPADSELRKFELSSTEASDGLMSTFTAIKCFTGQTSSHGTPLETGCHVEQYRGHHLLSRCSESGGSITIFMVRLAYGDFIAGMSYTESQSSKHFSASQIGHCFFPWQKTVEVPVSGRIDTLKVAFRPEGLVGIKLRFSHGDSSPWVGQHNVDGAAYGAIAASNVSGLFCFVAGLDVSTKVPL